MTDTPPTESTGPTDPTDPQTSDVPPTDSGPTEARSADAVATDPRTQLGLALQQVRREGEKAAAVHAAVEAVVAALATNLALLTLVPTMSATDRIPFVGGAVLFSGGLGFALRLRQPLVERFEAVNPPVSEALRTARDAYRRGGRNDDETADGSEYDADTDTNADPDADTDTDADAHADTDAGGEGPLTLALYETVLSRLRDTSSTRLLNSRQLALGVVLIFLLAIGSAQATVLDLNVHDIDARIGGSENVEQPTAGSPSPADAESQGRPGLQDGSLVLGESEDVAAGTEDVPVAVDVSGGGGDEEARAYENTGYGDGTAVEAQQAGYAEQQPLEDAELVREYNVRIRETADDNESSVAVDWSGWVGASHDAGGDR